MNEVSGNLFIFINPNECMGCHSCELACSASHSDYDIQTVVLEGVKLQPSRNTVIKVGNLTTVTQCTSCEDAPCIESCPLDDVIDRYQEFGGLVKIDEEKCIGCKACAKACPYDSINMVPVVPDPQKELAANGKKKKRKKLKALKCDLCFDMIGDDNTFNCACIEACPTKAIILTENHSNRIEAHKMGGYL